MSRFASVGRKGADDLEDSEEFGTILEGILEGGAKGKTQSSAVGTKGKYSSTKLDLSDSFESSEGGAAKFSRGSPAPSPKPTAVKSPSGFDDSGDDEFSVDIDVRKPGGKLGSAAAPSSSAKKSPKPTPGSDSGYSSTFLTGGRDKDEDSADIGFVPSILQGRQPRQRRQLNVTTTAAAAGGGGGGSPRSGTSALDELDRKIGLGPGRKDEGGVGNLRQPMSLSADSDSDDDGGVGGGGGATYTSSSIGSRSQSKAQDEDDRPSTGTASINNSNPAWLGSSSSSIKGAASQSQAQSPQHAERERIRQMQLQAEASQLEREAIERQYRLEIDTLKNKLASSGYSAGALSDDQIREMGEGSARQQREMSDLRRTIAQLELEIARLKDEATLQALRHREESKYSAEKQAQELADLERRKDEEIVSVERRHADTVNALKRIHTEELAALRERSKDGAALDQLAGQLKSASGSIKLLEEQLVSKYRGLDAAKDGQMEARERLLAEMEEKARLRAETAEAEGYRLKGLLMHMEHVATSLRSQGSEEKERLRQEHQRLHSMQLALEAERHAMQARLSEELALLKTRMGEADGEMQKLSHEKRQHSEAVAAAQRALDTDRAEFAAYLSSHSRTAEATAERLAEEEARLSRVREELSRERTLLEQRKAAAAGDLQDAERLRLDVQAGRDHIAREKAALQQAVRELQTASENLARQGESVDIQARALAEREMTVRDSAARLKMSASSLNKREAELAARAKELETRAMQIGETDRDLTNKKLSIAQANRELMSKNASFALASSSLPAGKENSFSAPPSKPGKPGTPSSPPQPHEHGGGGGEEHPSAWLEAFQQRVKQGITGGTAPSKAQAASASKGFASDRYLQETVFDAKKALQSARGASVRAGSSRDQVDKLLSNESSFIASMQARRARVALAASGAAAEQ